MKSLKIIVCLTSFVVGSPYKEYGRVVGFAIAGCHRNGQIFGTMNSISWNDPCTHQTLYDIFALVELFYFDSDV